MGKFMGSPSFSTIIYQEIISKPETWPNLMILWNRRLIMVYIFFVRAPIFYGTFQILPDFIKILLAKQNRTISWVGTIYLIRKFLSWSKERIVVHEKIRRIRMFTRYERLNTCSSFEFDYRKVEALLQAVERGIFSNNKSKIWLVEKNNRS